MTRKKETPVAQLRRGNFVDFAGLQASDLRTSILWKLKF
jgi:hypothetical protein